MEIDIMSHALCFVKMKNVLHTIPAQLGVLEIFRQFCSLLNKDFAVDQKKEKNPISVILNLLNYWT